MIKSIPFSAILGFVLMLTLNGSAQEKAYTRADSLRGSINSTRDWWDVQHYSIYVEPNYNQKSIEGKVDIKFKVIKPGKSMQIDLQQPMQLTKAYVGDLPMKYSRDGNVYFIDISTVLVKDSTYTLALKFDGKVTIAKNPPWDGGWIFTKDKLGRPWMSVACQGLGASVWFPCKDHQSDEPDLGATLKINVPDSLVAVGNGRLMKKEVYNKGYTAYEWKVKNPINNYNIIPYIGKYVSFEETYPGEKGPLDCIYYVLDYNLEKAKTQFKQVPLMLKAFEAGFGPYPFYEDGFKLVESPHLGMEHQSAVAYGNGYINGYRGRDLSNSGWGLKWDFIIVHESGHEWFGNNITSNDMADMWIHESFTNYSETVFTTYHYGKEAGDAYVQGTRKLISNDKPIIANYGVNDEGSGDMYYKGGNMIHYIKQLFQNDDAFVQALREMNKTFYHQTVTTKQIEDFLSEKVGIDLSKMFDQYLRNTIIPEVAIERNKDCFNYRWINCIEGYNIPVKLIVNGEGLWLKPTKSPQQFLYKSKINSVVVDPNCYAGLKEAVGPE
jgi:aminopeptidase N